jgi:hypothetical protein
MLMEVKSEGCKCPKCWLTARNSLKETTKLGSREPPAGAVDKFKFLNFSEVGQLEGLENNND